RRISIMIWDEDDAPPTTGGSAPGQGSGVPGPAPPSSTGGGDMPVTDSQGALSAPSTDLTPATSPNGTGGGSFGLPTTLPGASSPLGPSTGTVPGRPQAVQPLTGDQLERLLIERAMDEASAPDLSTVGPPVSPRPADQ
ncbi:MAG: hypothetical protein ACRCTY_03685, partial [Candidatus Adiutrix sp.]